MRKPILILGLLVIVACSATQGAPTLFNASVVRVDTNGYTVLNLGPSLQQIMTEIDTQLGSLPALKTSLTNDVSDALATNTAAINASVASLSNLVVSLVGSLSASMNTNAVVPIGGIMPWPTATPPAGGWLECNGQGVATNVAPNLYAVIGYTYGGSAGTFNVPDLRGRTIYGLNTGTFNVMGATGGEETHVLTVAELAAHTHTLSTYSLGENITHVSRGDDTYRGPATSSSSGSGAAHNTLPPYMVLKYIIKY